MYKRQTKDGTGVRDYIHVMDLAEGHISAMKYLKNIKDRCFSILNLGTGKGTSVFEMIDVFEKVNNIKIKSKIKERRLCDAAEVFADCSKANEVLDWFAKRSLEDICRDGWLWHKANPNGY